MRRPPKLPRLLVSRCNLVRWIFGSVKRHEELLHVPIHAAFAHLIRIDLHERVVSAFRSSAELERAEWSGVGARSRGRRVLFLADAREKLIGFQEDFCGRQMASVEVSHYGVFEGRSSSTSCIQSIRSSG